MIRQIGPEIWESLYHLKFMGFPMTVRTTIIRLTDGSLWLHSPGPLTSELRAELEALGPIRYAVAPNNMHHLFVAEYLAVGAKLYIAPGLVMKRADLRDAEVLSGTPPAEWAGQIDQLRVQGNDMLNETVFLHRASRSLIVTDLAVHLGSWDHWLVRLYAYLNGIHGKFGLSYGLRYLFKDRQAARASVENILGWDFDRVVICHGPVLQEAAKARLAAAFAFLGISRA